VPYRAGTAVTLDAIGRRATGYRSFPILRNTTVG
jgi:hypothetical protein